MLGDVVNMDIMSLRYGHFKVLVIASLGQLIGASLATLVGIILPMLQLHLHSNLSPIEQGVICCTSLVGITIGSFVLGKLSDQFGYLLLFRLCPLIILFASLFAFFFESLPALVIGLFFMGFGIGGEYSLDCDYVSEIMPRRWRLFMVGVAKAAASLGNILMAGLCYLLLIKSPTSDLWNKLILIISVIALLMLLLRIRFAESPGWLVAHGKPKEAEQSVRYFLGNDVSIGEIANAPIKANLPKTSWKELFNRSDMQKVVFSGLPWACEGMSVYGIGVFLPILIMALGIESDSIIGLERIIDSVKITFYISIFILLGFVGGLMSINRVYHVRLQAIGFILSAVGLLFLLLSYNLHWSMLISVVSFMFFEFFLNAGPHMLTYVIPTQIYSVNDRGLGSGLAASCGKIGAILGVLFMPMLLGWGGIKLALWVNVVVLLIGAIVTLIVGRKVMPKNREKK